MSHFIDLFSEQPAAYAAARPRYPEALFDAIAALAPGRARAWDCGCGNGQAAVGLARHFERVDATDASAAQIAEALPGERIHYAVAPAEASGLPPASIDAACVAQALHWFDAPRFFAELRRVLRPGGVFVACGYDRLAVEPGFDAAFESLLLDVIRPHWAPQNALLWNGYRDLPWPLEPLTLPSLAIELDWSLAELLAYAQTWSATRRCIAAQGPGFLQRAAADLAPLWGHAPRRRVHMPLHLRAGRRLP